MEFKQHVHFSPELEKAVIGACLIEREAFGKVYQIINAECFYYQTSQTVFQTIKDMYINGIPIDLVTVNDHLQRVKGITKFSNTPTLGILTRMTLDVVSSLHIEYHSFLIKTMWMEREIIKITHGGTKLEGDARNKIADLQTKLYELQQKTTAHDWQDMTQLMVDMYRHQEQMKKHGGIGLSCGIKELDKYNGGFHPGQMIVIGARPSVGKSALAGCIAIHAAKNNNKVGIVSLEMSNVEIAARLAAVDTETDFQVLYRGLYAEEKQTLEVYKKIGSSTSRLPIYVTDKTNVSIVDIRSKADKLMSLHGLNLLIIDYLQLIDVPEMSNRNRENEIAKVSRYCKIMAKEMNIPVILLCQLNRESAHRKGEDRYPRLSDIRESGSIEQDADVVMFLHRDSMIGIDEDEQGNSTANQADLVVSKWRNGKSNFIVAMDFDPPKMKFNSRTNQQGSWKPVNTQYFD